MNDSCKQGLTFLLLLPVSVLNFWYVSTIYIFISVPPFVSLPMLFLIPCCLYSLEFFYKKYHFLIFPGLQEAILMLYLYYDISSWWEIYLTFPRVWSRYYKDIICQSWTWLTATPCRWHYFCVREGIYLILNGST